MPQRPEIHKPSGFKPRANRKEILRRYDATHERNRDVYGTGDWKRLSLLHRQANPLCVQCLQEGRTEAAVLVDHIVPVSVNRSLAFEASNLQGLCRKCHAIKTMRDIIGHGSKAV